MFHKDNSVAWNRRTVEAEVDAEEGRQTFRV